MAHLAFGTLPPRAHGKAANRRAQGPQISSLPPDSPAEKIEVIYLLGCGRSGSTLLDLVLGAHPRVTSVGEVWYHSRWLKNNFECTCGSPFASCVFWQAVAAKLRVFEHETVVAPVQNRQAKTGAFLRLLGSSRLPSREQAQGYALATQRLFKAVQEVANKPMILDSSKNPMRLLYLYASGFFNVKIIHLIRDGRAYLNSTRQPVRMPAQGGQIAPPQSAWRATWRWLLTNALSNLLCSRLPKTSWCRIKYEDFATDSAAITQRMCEFLNLNYSPELLEGDKPVAHNISGSRWRYESASAIRLDEKWRAELPASRRLVFNILAGWLNRQYGY